MRLCVVGIGYVGLVSAACFAEGGNNVICVDNDKKRIDDLKNGRIPIFEPGLEEIVKHNEKAGRLTFTTDLAHGVKNSSMIFLAVGTPSAPDGSADISAILCAASDIAACMPDYRIIVTKSTVPVGTHKLVSDLIRSKTDKPFDYVSNPEFLKEGAAVADFMRPDRVVIGTNSQSVRQAMRQLYSAFTRKTDRLIFMDPVSAEMTKYAANAMLATKISFMNEISALCEKVGADVELVRHGIGSDSRIGPSFIFPGVGFGGSCFPKDVRSLIHIGKINGVPMSIAHAVQEANLRQQQRFADRVIAYFRENNLKTVAAWGLAFKAKTDDIRESPAIFCINRFIEAGLTVKAFDPEAMAAAKAAMNCKIEVFEKGYDALRSADALVIFTDWQEFRNPDFALIKETLNRPVIFDGRNLYSPEYVRSIGFEYYSIGRP